MVIEGLKVQVKDQIKNDIELKGLGKINIICGKNNSGKSTLLLAIDDSKKLVVRKKEKKDVFLIIWTLMEFR